MITRPGTKTLAYLAFITICLVWGTTYLALRVAVVQFPPLLFSMIRFISAGAILMIAVSLIRPVKWPSRKSFGNKALSGFLMVTLGISLVGWAEVYVSSGLAAIICSMMPFWVIFINLLRKEEPVTLPLLFGIVIGFSGILLIFGEHLDEFANSNYTWGILVIFISNFFWVAGSFLMRATPKDENAYFNSGLQLFLGGIFLLPLSLVIEDYHSIVWTSEVIYSLLYLILIGSIVTFTSYTYALKHLSFTLVSLYAYINPIVAVILGWLILQERLNFQIGLGALITLFGIYLANRGYSIGNSWKSFLLKMNLRKPEL